MNADDLRVGMLHSNKDIGPAFPDGDRLSQILGPCGQRNFPKVLSCTRRTIRSPASIFPRAA
jgi:hypothetical protein